MILPWIKTLIQRDEVTSTSDLARTLLEAEAIDLPLCVIAKRQTKGRGQRENTWWSDEGSLTFTLAIDPAVYHLKREHEPRIALAAAVTLIRGLPHEIQAGIRWPNDIEVAGRKLGGILPERIETPFGPRILIGIGLNLETKFDEAPPEVRRMAVSLSELTKGPSLNRDRFMQDLLPSLSLCLHMLASDNPRLFLDMRSLDTLRNQAVQIDMGTHIIDGIARGMDREGALIVVSEGKSKRLFGGRVLRDSP